MDGRQRARKLTVEEVFANYKGKREGLIKALTTDFERFEEKCDPEKDSLCLYGLPDGSWEVKVPAALVPPEHPEPTLGINFAKDGMRISDWQSVVAIHSDAWLMSNAFYLAYFMFDKNDRNRLFQMINRLLTVFEVVTQKQAEQLSLKQSNGNKTKSSGKMSQPRTFAQQPERVKMSSPPKEDGNSVEEEEEEAEEAYEQETSYCGACGCGDENDVDGFWIWCDVCEKWFHGQCVKITPAKAEHIKHYKCPACSNKKARVH